MTDFEPDLTIREAAAILRKQEDWIARLARAGQLPGAYQLAARGRWAIRRADFDAWRASLGPKTVTDPNAMEPPSQRSRRRRQKKA